MRGRLMICLTFLSFLLACHGEIFTAMATMKRALVIEKKFAAELHSYVPLIKDASKREELSRLADEFDNVPNEALAEPENYLANPINAYTLCKRFTTDIKYIRELLQDPTLQGAFDDMLYIHKAEIPDHEDFGGVIDALLRLQDTYEIPTSHFVDGTFATHISSPRMTASDCFEIGKYAFEKKDRYHAILWLLESLSTFELEGGDRNVDKILLLDYLTYAASDQGNHYHALKYAEQLLELKPSNPATVKRITDVMNWLRSEFIKDNKSYGDEGPIDLLSLPPLKNRREVPRRQFPDEYETYEALCRGEDVLPNPYVNSLKCYYTTSNNNPLLLLAPVKVEEMYKSPDVVLFRDVISDKEIEVVKNLSTPILKRATVNDPVTGKLMYAPYRVSRSAWLYDADYDPIKVISNRISAIVNLDMVSAEGLQVVNYGIGGQYEPHYDHSRGDVGAFPKSIGNRIATWIFYLSDVSAGGYTVFTRTGLKVPPVKGAAAFWWNLHKNGEGDSMTKHAGCPVLSGSKWVANKWTHIIGQEWRRPCTLNEHE